MSEISLHSIFDQFERDLRYTQARRVRVNPFMYQELSDILSQVEMEKCEVIDIIEDPVVETYVIE